MLQTKQTFFSIFSRPLKNIACFASSMMPLFTVTAILLLAACDGDKLSNNSAGSGDSSPPPIDGGGDNDDQNNLGPALPFSIYSPHWLDIGVFSAASNCNNCHKASTDGSYVLRNPINGEDISPAAGWQHSMMANSFPDPYYQAVMQNEVSEFPALAGFIEDKCLTCHTPMARTHAHQTGTSLSAEDCSLPDGCYRLEDSLEQMHAKEGISCTACHQMQETDNDSGKYIISPTDKIIYGPQASPTAGPMLNNTQYTVAASAHISASEFCSGCHDLSTPSIDVNTGELVSNHEFPEQTPYREWLNSIYSQAGTTAQSCQDCHMPEIDNYQTALAVRGNGTAHPQWPKRDNYSQHTFVGANTYILSMLKEQRDILGIADSTTVAGFERQIELTREFIKNNTAELSVGAISYDSNLNIDITIQNKSGHKLPTSYPSRRVWLNLIVSDNSGRVLFQSGTPDNKGWLASDMQHSSSDCTAVKKPATYQVLHCYSPHQNIISTEQQVAVYEAVMADSNGHSNYVLLYGNHYIKDNRIPPIGYTELSSNTLFDSKTAIAGAALQDSDFNKASNGDEGTGSDTVHYQIPWAADWPTEPSEIRVEAKLYYQTIRPAFAKALQRDNTLIQHFTDSYEQQAPVPELIDSLSVPLP